MTPPTLERLGVILNPAATPLWKDGHVDMPSGTVMRSKLIVVFLKDQRKNKMSESRHNTRVDQTAWFASPSPTVQHSGTSLQWTPLGPSWLSCIEVSLIQR